MESLKIVDDPPESVKQAQEIWSMLDNMADKDPSAYRTFINKQLQEGIELMRPPEPHMCVLSHINHGGGGACKKLYINVMEWARVPAPKSETDSMPVSGGPLYTGTDSTGQSCSVVAVALNGAALKDFGLDSSLKAQRHDLVCLVIDFVSDQSKLGVSKNYTVLPKQQHLFGSLDDARHCLTGKRSVGPASDPSANQNLSEVEKTFGPLSADCKKSLLAQLSTLNTSGGEDTKGDRAELALPRQQEKKGAKGVVIEELWAADAAPLPIPEHSVTFVTDDEDQRMMVVKVALPGVKSVRECKLSISEDDVHLLVRDRFELTLALPETVLADDASAKFSAKLSLLTLSFPTPLHQLGIKETL